MRKQSGISFGQVLLATVILVVVTAAVLYPTLQRGKDVGNKKSPSAGVVRTISMAAIAYGGDNDDHVPITTNGWLCRMQNIPDQSRTINCPGPGTQDFPAHLAAAGRRTDAWPLILLPYVKSRGMYVDPHRGDKLDIFATPPKAASDEGYDAEEATYRNQNRFPMFGLNYMFLSPLRIPKDKLRLDDAINYAVSESHAFSEADDPSGTIFFTQSQRSRDDTDRGFFVVNAPGMWKAFAKNDKGYVAFSSGTSDTGDWCWDTDVATAGFQKETNFCYIGENDGCNASFLDGHTKYYHDAALASGTDYSTGRVGTGREPLKMPTIIDKKHYLWNLTDNNYYGL
jgi:prepilin-type processing-associated H-X9-DG protein